MEPCLKPPRTTAQPSPNLVKPWWNPGGTLPQTTPEQPSQSLVECGGTLVEPCLKPRRTPQPSQNLMEAWWNRGSNHPGPPRSPRRTWWNPGAQTTPDHPAALAKPGGTLARSPRRTWWNPGGTVVLKPNHPGPPRSPRRTWWNPGGTVVLKPPRTTPQPLQNLVELWWNPRGTLVEPYLRAALDHPGAYLG